MWGVIAPHCGRHGESHLKTCLALEPKQSLKLDFDFDLDLVGLDLGLDLDLDLELQLELQFGLELDLERGVDVELGIDFGHQIGGIQALVVQTAFVVAKLVDGA